MASKERDPISMCSLIAAEPSVLPTPWIVFSGYYGETNDPFTILGVTMTIGDQDPIALIAPQAAPVEVPYGEWLDHAHSAVHRIDLKDILDFKEGQLVTVVAKVRAPGDG